MGQHTPERLALTSQDDQVTGCANFESRYGVDAIVLYHDNAKADARRIVQCWNAHDELVKASQTVINVIHSVENRCMAADGPVTPTCDEITDAELRQMYEAARAALRAATGDQS